MECGADVTPVGAVPEELMAAFADEEFVEPEVGARRDAVPKGIFVNRDEAAAATHAACSLGLEIKFAEDELELVRGVERGRDPEGRDRAVAQYAAFHEHTVGGEDRCAGLLGFAKQIVVIDVRFPMRIVAGARGHARAGSGIEIRRLCGCGSCRWANLARLERGRI